MNEVLNKQLKTLSEIFSVESFQDLENLGKVMSHPLTIKILNFIKNSEEIPNVKTIYTNLEIPQSTCSGQLKKMREINIVNFVKNSNNNVFYSIHFENLEKLVKILSTLKSFEDVNS